jgi:hypothetical protein
MGYPKSGVIFTILLAVFAVFNFSIVEAADYFPLSIGNRWVYYPSFGTGYRIDTIAGEELVNNVPTFIWNRLEAPDDNYSEKRWLAYVNSELR